MATKWQNQESRSRGCCIRFEHSFNGRTQHIDAQIEEVQKPLSLTAPNERKSPCRATQRLHVRQGNSKWELLQGHLMYGKHSRAVWVSEVPCGPSSICSGMTRADAP